MADGFMQDVLKPGDIAICEKNPAIPGHIVTAENGDEHIFRVLIEVEGIQILTALHADAPALLAKDWPIAGVVKKLVRTTPSGRETYDYLGGLFIQNN